jgi:hypothetical protein
LKKLATAVLGLAIFAPSALAASHFLKVSPGKANQGKTVTISGSVGGGCRSGHQNDTATIYSGAFKGATKHSFAGIPSISASLSHGSSFSVKLKLTKSVKTGTYTVTGRCGGGKFGSATLKVTKAAPSPPQQQFY